MRHDCADCSIVPFSVPFFTLPSFTHTCMYVSQNSILTSYVAVYFPSIMSTSNEPKRATDLMSTTRASACSPPHRQSSFAKFIEALRLDEEIEDDIEEEDNDYNDDANALPFTAGITRTVTSKASTTSYTLQDRYDHHQHSSSTYINIKAPSARDILLRSIIDTHHHSDADDGDMQDTNSRNFSSGNGRHFLHADNLSKFIEKTQGDLDKEEHEINAAITTICSAGVKGPVSGKGTSRRQDSFHDALVDIILTERAKASQDGDNDKKKRFRKNTTMPNIVSDLRRRISDEIEWKPKRLSANMA